MRTLLPVLVTCIGKRGDNTSLGLHALNSLLVHQVHQVHSERFRAFQGRGNAHRLDGSLSDTAQPFFPPMSQREAFVQPCTCFPATPAQSRRGRFYFIEPVESTVEIIIRGNLKERRKWLRGQEYINRGKSKKGKKKIPEMEAACLHSLTATVHIDARLLIEAGGV